MHIRRIVWALSIMVLLSLTTPVHATTIAQLDVYDDNLDLITGNPFSLKVGEGYLFVAKDANSSSQYKIELYLETSFHNGDFTSVTWSVKADAGATYSCTHPDTYSYSCTKTGGGASDGLIEVSAHATVAASTTNAASARIRALPSGTPSSTNSRSWWSAT